MNDIPFSIPDSLASYLLQFENNPQKSVKRLKKQLNRRGPDPVGYFLLGWFYFQNGQKSEAINCAVKAKNYAPGSPFFEKLHYFFTHPDLFEARQVPSTNHKKNAINFDALNGTMRDLDLLIKKLSEVDSSRIKADSTFFESESRITLPTDAADDIASETLANIHSAQQNYKEAIEIYQKLKQRYPENKTHYNKHIQQLKIKVKQENEE